MIAIQADLHNLLQPNGVQRVLHLVVVDQHQVDQGDCTTDLQVIILGGEEHVDEHLEDFWRGELVPRRDALRGDVLNRFDGIKFDYKLISKGYLYHPQQDS